MSEHGSKALWLSGLYPWLSHPDDMSLSQGLGTKSLAAIAPILPFTHITSEKTTGTKLRHNSSTLLTSLALDSLKLIKRYHLFLHGYIMFWEEIIPFHNEMVTK